MRSQVNFGPEGCGDGDADRISVLIVEQDQALRGMIRDGLDSLGFSATAVADATEAARIAVDEKFEVVVSNVRVPGMSGADLARRMTACPGSPRVILFGASEDSRDVKEAYLSGAVHFVPKPLCIRDLAQAVHLASMERRYDCKGLVRTLRPQREGVA